jgi:hypothetical protein
LKISELKKSLENFGIDVNSLVNFNIDKTVSMSVPQLPKLPFNAKLPLNKLISVRKEALQQVQSRIDEITAEAFKKALETVKKSR